MNNQIIRLAEHGHDFFLLYPQAVARLEVTVAGRNVADTFHFVHDAITKEQADHAIANADKSTTQTQLVTLGKSLRHAAYALGHGVNSTLELLNRSAEEVTFLPTVDFISSVEQFVTQLEKVKDVLNANTVYATSYAKFLQELADYKTAAGKIGETRVNADVQKKEFFGTVDSYEPVISALHALIQRYLAKTDPLLLAEYQKGLAHKRKNGAETTPVATPEAANETNPTPTTENSPTDGANPVG